MGRTHRIRKRKKCDERGYSLSDDPIFVNLVKWMKNNCWVPTCDLQPVSFHHCGRGLMARKHVKKGDVLFSLPFHLMITTATIQKSSVSCVLQNGNFKVQDAVALFLVWEMSNGSQSYWYDYIKSLPVHFSLPIFCSSNELILLPSFVVDIVKSQKTKIQNTYKYIEQVFESLQHCFLCHKNHHNELVHKNISYENFLWAWCVVNTRSVFYKRKEETCIKTVDSDNLALAPFLDMFNHSNESDLIAELNDDGNYNIVATKQIKKYSQVFIHYGHHSNLHLYVEYGFTIPNNIYDSIILTVEEVVEVAKMLNLLTFSKLKKKFICDHNLNRDLLFSAEGLSFNARALIYLITSTDDCKTYFHKKIYSDSYDFEECNIIKEVSLELVNRKYMNFNRIVDNMNQMKQVSPSFSVARSLLKEYLKVLIKARFNIEGRHIAHSANLSN